MTPEKKIWFRPSEVHALLKASEEYKRGEKFGMDALWQTIRRNKECEKLNLRGKYSQTQLCHKAIELYKEKHM